MHAQSCPTLCEPRDCNPPGSIVHRIFQAKILEWVAISSSRGSSWPRGRTHLSCISGIARQILYYWRHLRSPFQVHFYSVVNMIHQLNKFHLNTYSLVRFPDGSDGKDCVQCRKPELDAQVGRIPWRRERQPTPVFLPGKFHEQRGLVGYSPCGCKESDMTDRLTLIFTVSEYLFFARYFVQVKKFICC